MAADRSCVSLASAQQHTLEHWPQQIRLEAAKMPDVRFAKAASDGVATRQSLERRLGYDAQT
jgi:hypothetical protein